MMLPASIPLALLAAASFTDRLARSLNNRTFAGIHQLDWFDWSLLIPYFATLAILSVYGLHRYDIIRTYFKYRKNATKDPPGAFCAAAAGNHPVADLQRALRHRAADR